MTTAVQYTGQPDAIIRYETDPWLERHGEPLMMRHISLSPAVGNDCGTCAGEAIAGVLAQATGAGCVERCDECERFPGDFEAALALAAAIGPDVTVWFFPQEATQ